MRTRKWMAVAGGALILAAAARIAATRGPVPLPPHAVAVRITAFGASAPTRSVDLRSPAAVDRLVTDFDRLAWYPDAPFSCPAGTGAHIDIMFEYHGGAAVVARTDGCAGVSVVSGNPRLAGRRWLKGPFVSDLDKALTR